MSEPEESLSADAAPSTRFRTFLRAWAFWIVISLITISGLVLYTVKIVYPLEIAEWKQRRELRKAGVQEITIEGLHAFELSSCVPGADCACIALVHGLGDQALTWRKLFLEGGAYWISRVRLLALDLPGFGESPPPSTPAGFRARELGKTVGLALSRLKGCHRWMVVGNSFGGWVAAWAAIEWPKVVNKVAFVGATGLRVQWERGMGKLLSDGSAQALKEFQKRAYHSPRELPDAVWEAAARRARNGNSKFVIAAQTTEDLLDTHLPSMNRGSLFFWGASDRIVTPDEGRAMAALVRNSAFREAPECGHLPQKECPAALLRALNELIRFGAL